ncbi:MAG TPA: FkbM family methyltransferase [Gaiellaceae bacterium]|nr:FkbM family methyltransferase [Gaiellaceae bacterium]
MEVPGIVARPAAWAAREYVLRFPVARGKGVVVRQVAPRLPVRYREFDAELPGGGTVVLRFDEWLGRSYVQHGRSFDAAELAFMRDALAPGGTAIDVGANVGVYTVAAARHVGQGGRVLAVEADDEYVPRLRSNLARNGLANVEVVAAAAGSADGEVELIIAADRAFSSIKPLVSYRGAGATRTVPQLRLDTLWRDAGEPGVGFVKIDVEGAELEVLAGAGDLLARCRPALVVEVNPGTEDEVRRRLGALGYRDVTPAGFSKANRAYSAGAERVDDRAEDGQEHGGGDEDPAVDGR